jgi:hypothetical protein
MPIKPPPPIALYGDLERARQIARAWKPLDQLSPADANIVARAIADGIAEGRGLGLAIARSVNMKRNDSGCRLLLPCILSHPAADLSG